MRHIKCFAFLALCLAAFAAPAWGAAVLSQAEIEEAISRSYHRSGGSEFSRLQLDMRILPPISPLSRNTVEVSRLKVDAGSSRFTASVTWTDPFKGPQQQPISGVRNETREIPVLARAIAANEEIHPDDVIMQTVRAENLRAGIITRKADLIGKSARRTISAEQPVRAEMVKMPTLVRKNSLITVTYAAPGISLTGQVMALQDGGEGDVIKVQNTQSKRRFEATITGTDEVRVGPNPQQLAQR
ncbi:MAG: flagellar basal body P-ring formation chaperone FlgA [Dongiaceae bacterium]